MTADDDHDFRLLPERADLLFRGEPGIDLLVGAVGDEAVPLLEPAVKRLLRQPLLGKLRDQIERKLVSHRAEGLAVERTEALDDDGPLARLETKGAGDFGGRDAGRDPARGGAGLAAQAGHGIGPARDRAVVVVDAGADDDGPAAAGRFEEPLPGDLVE